MTKRGGVRRPTGMKSGPSVAVMRLSAALVPACGGPKGGGRTAIDAFVKANPDPASSVIYQTAAGTENAGNSRRSAAVVR